MTTSTSPAQSTDVRNDALRRLTHGLYVLTVCTGDMFHAATVTWVSQVSFEPPLVLTALRRNSRLAQAVRNAHRFALNILAVEQEPLAEQFFDHQTIPATSDLLAGHPFRGGVGHCPLLIDALGWLECRVAAEPSSPGDHTLLLGEVTAAGLRPKGVPLVLWGTRWTYGGLNA